MSDCFYTSKYIGKYKRELAIFYPTTRIPVGPANNKKRIISGIKLERRRIWESRLEWWRYNRYALDRIRRAAHRDNTGRIALHADLKQILSRRPLIALAPRRKSSCENWLPHNSRLSLINFNVISFPVLSLDSTQTLNLYFTLTNFDLSSLKCN